MRPTLRIGLIGTFRGRPLDVFLPVVRNGTPQDTVPARCFHLFGLSNTKLLLFSQAPDGTRRFAQLDIRSSCKENCDIGIAVVERADGLFLRTFIDREHCGLYALPAQLAQ